MIYWADSQIQAADDAYLKGISKWRYFDKPVDIDLDKYEAVYLQAGNILMEQYFAKLQNKYQQCWC